jgi:hypothetical protein
MIITIKDVENGTVEIKVDKQIFDTEEPNFEQVYMRMMVGLEGITKDFLGKIDAPDPKAFRENFYDILDQGFGQFLKKVFPEIKVGDFDLTAAAIVKAQDEIIQEAESQGKTYEEILDKYNDIANKYVNEKRLN